MSNAIPPPASFIWFPTFTGKSRWGLLFVLIVAGYYLGIMMFPVMFAVLGVDHNLGWFLDSYAIMAANDAQAAGLNPWMNNPFDPMGRPHVYSGWWLHLGGLGLTRHHNFLFGGACVILFFIAALWMLRPRSASQLVWYLAVICSAPIVLGVERANNDLVMFALLVPVVPMVLSEKPWVRWCAMIPLLAATGLKFYPAVAGLLILAGARRREALMRAGVAAVGLALVFFSLRHDLERLRGAVPNPQGPMSFGAAQAFVYGGLGESLAALAGVITGIVLLVTVRPWRWLSGWDLKLTDPDTCLFMIGAVLLTGCFFTGSSYTYRLIYCVMLAPLLWRMMTETACGTGARTTAWVTAGLMLIMLWSDSVLVFKLSGLVGKYPDEFITEWADRVTFWRSPLVWAFFVCLMGFLARFVAVVWRGFLNREMSETEPAEMRIQTP